MDIKKKMAKEVWTSHSYYDVASLASEDMKHQGMRVLKELARSAKKIVDLGCGEGTRLSLILPKNTEGTGVDISATAVSLGKSRYPTIKFIQADLESIPLESGSFDLVYSAYVLEHLSTPEKVLTEAVRLLKRDGYLILIAPNYGSPNRSSPPFKGSRIKKLIMGAIDDFVNVFRKQKELGWLAVEPIAAQDKYDVDWDTTVEPYIGSLIKYLKYKGLVVKDAFSCWSEELPGAKVHQKIFKMLGQLGLYPFWMWGPHLVVVVKKL